MILLFSEITQPLYVTLFYCVIDAGPAECHACIEGDAVTCSANQIKQTCATDPNSLGTTHCGSMAGKFLYQSGSMVEGFVRGCIDCSGKQTFLFVYLIIN